MPVAPPGWTARFAGYADEFVWLGTPGPFFAIGQFYADFSQTSDDEVTRWLRAQPDLADLRIGYFGASTGAAAALWAATEPDAGIAAVVSRGGRPDLTVIPGATHLFEEPGTLQAAAEAARDWFTRHLAPVQQPAR